MNALPELQHNYIMVKSGVAQVSCCIAWAIDRLQADEEGDDLDVVLLAAATDGAEAMPLVEKILEKYLGPAVLNEQFVAGKYISELWRAYRAKSFSRDMVDGILSKLYYRLGYPNWLTMLRRNCEYATDVHAFRIPFEDEFAYIAGLWEESASLDEFMKMYDREVSNSHDIRR